MKAGCLIRFADDSYSASSVRGKFGIVTDVRPDYVGPRRPYERWHIDVLVEGVVMNFHRDELQDLEDVEESL